MLPDWDFDGDDGKRREFIGWVNAELDHLAATTTERFILDSDPPDDWLEAAHYSRSLKTPVGRPSDTDAHKAADGMDAAIADYILIKHIFQNCWPGRNRQLKDKASAERIAVTRNWREMREVAKDSDWAAVHSSEADAREAHEIEKAERLQREWRRWKDRPGRRMGNDDVAFLTKLRQRHN